jgi:DNA-binding MarR family transcriptional regulator
MISDSESEKLALRVWFLTHRTRDVLRTCEDRIFGEYGLTAEQYAVLSIMKLLGDPVRVTDLAHWLERSANSVSMIVDRMVKAGLVTRKRGRGDRRAVHLSITSKGEVALRPATLAGWKFIQTILSPLSDEDRRAFVSLHEVVKYQALHYINPRLTMEEMKSNEITNQPDSMRRLASYVSASAGRTKLQGAEKRKTKSRAKRGSR